MWRLLLLLLLWRRLQLYIRRMIFFVVTGGVISVKVVTIQRFAVFAQSGVFTVIWSKQMRWTLVVRWKTAQGMSCSRAHHGLMMVVHKMLLLGLLHL